MSDDLFTMIAEKPEIEEARKEFHAALEDFRAEALTAPNEGMYEEQEMWCPVWQGKLNCLTMALNLGGVYVLREPSSRRVWYLGGGGVVGCGCTGGTPAPSSRCVRSLGGFQSVRVVGNLSGHWRMTRLGAGRGIRWGGSGVESFGIQELSSAQPVHIIGAPFGPKARVWFEANDLCAAVNLWLSCGYAHHLVDIMTSHQ
ncbi:hypothetical protein BDN67DRAFT_984873 [Paxillus ammoniavirescens]|nr:hypothetical protein BDN67DRAFT_984873 [Paxillus ammoniavirescens]